MKKIRLDVLLFCCFGLCLTVTVLFSLLFFQEKKETPTVKTTEPAEEQQERPGIDPLHTDDEHRGSDIATKEKDFMDNGPVVIDGLSFEGFRNYPGSTAENTGTTLIGTSSKDLLFKAYGGLLYLYDRTHEDDHAVTTFGDFAILSDDQRYVFFTRFEEPVERKRLKLYVHSLETSLQEPIADIPDGLTIEDLQYSDGVVTYVAKDMNYTTFQTQSIVIPDFRKQRDVNAIETQDLSMIQGHFQLVNGKRYGYHYEQHKLFAIEPGIGVIEAAAFPEPENVSFTSSVSYLDPDHWALVYSQNSDGKSVFRTNKGIVTDIKNPTDVTHLTPDVLLVQDGSHLVLYNTKTSRTTGFLPNIARFYVQGNTIAIQTVSGDIQSVDYQQK